MAWRGVAGVLLLGTGGCMTLQPVADAGRYVKAERPARIWLTTEDGTTLLVQAPRIYVDSVYGYDAGGEQVWVALGDVRHAQAKQTSAVRTGLLFAGIVGGVVAAGVTLSGSGDSRVETPVDVVDQSRRSPRTP